MDSRPPRAVFLADVLAALARRRRAIRYQLLNLTVENMIEHGEGGDVEKLEVEAVLVGNNPPTTLRVHVWDDRWVWVDARAHRKAVGWLWEFTRQGRISGDHLGGRLVQAFEASIGAASSVEARNEGRLAEIWASLLALGPREIA